ncbi:hypothetical protein DSOL_4611 [Desulfosporosinus metallidurans]|uniref:Uncharacterized protein n=1 Tax=Desulfosporosinus metallidurans TaxID=1888891 RepID=A0A1Q8QJ27_9FIRM|nr:hypothetical protein DSOL_4611 [Desulfosporosinus metallidurans]
MKLPQVYTIIKTTDDYHSQVQWLIELCCSGQQLETANISINTEFSFQQWAKRI